MNITRVPLAIFLPMRLGAWVLILLCSVNLAIADSGETVDRSANGAGDTHD